MQLYWTDLCEILFFATGFYYWTAWLKQDKTKPLLGCFFVYCTICIAAYAVPLPTVGIFLWMTAPVGMMLFIIMHEQTLQRNFVALKQQVPKAQYNPDWLETLVRTSLVSLNNNQAVLCLLEHTDGMKEFIAIHAPVNAPLHQKLLHMMLTNEAYNQEQMVWVNTAGTLIGINAAWHDHETIITTDSGMPVWQQQALLYTTTTDALVFHMNPENRMLTLIAHGKSITTRNAQHALTMLKKHIAKKPEKKSYSGEPHVLRRKKTDRTQQRTP